MNRSKKCLFIAHCLSAQAVVAKGLAKKAPAMVKPIIQFCLDNDINLFQMPCPEIKCESGGITRDLHGKAWYENNGLRETSRQIAEEQVQYMKDLTNNGCIILAIMGVEFSPSCSPTYLNKGRKIDRNKGIFIEELEHQLEKQELQIQFIGVNQNWNKKLAKQLAELLV